VPTTLARASASTLPVLVLQARHQGTAVNPSPDVAATLRRWEGINQAARGGTANGRRSSKAMEGSASRPWKQGGCVVGQERLVACGPPRNGSERPLAITLTKARSRMLTGLAVLAVRSALARLGEPGVIRVGAFPGTVRCVGRCDPIILAARERHR
jgi:hypothetical protein